MLVYVSISCVWPNAVLSLNAKTKTKNIQTDNIKTEEMDTYTNIELDNKCINT
jgi:hypothetical protein